MTRSTSTLIRIVIAFGAQAVLAGAAHAQAIERHVPQIDSNSGQVTIAEPEVAAGAQDPQPIGPALRAIRLIGPTETVAASAPDGVSVGTIKRLEDADVQATLRSALSAFLGKPMSFKLIGDIKTAIAERFREVHYPFVSLSTPEQEISGGSLQIRVIEFKLGKASVSGVSPGTADSILGRVDLKSGSPINTRSLSRRLDWINRYPFRHLQGVFSPGAAFGTTDLSLLATESKPWSVYAGYNNDGSRATGHDRFFIGGSVGGLLIPDSVMAFQLTGSGDALQGDSDFGYASGAVTYRAPVGPGEIEAVFDRLRTHTYTDDFLTRIDVTEGSLGYRLPLGANWPGNGNANVRFGVEANHQTRRLLFGGIPVYEAGMDVAQVYLGLQQTHEKWGDLDVSVHFSPGDLTSQNSDEQASLYSFGRMDDASYVYFTFDYGKQTDLGFGQWIVDLSGQYSPDTLPYTGQSSLGGLSLVRGYSSDDGAFDTAAVLRNELRFDSHSIPSGDVAPYLFADGGWGRDNYAETSEGVASLGAGLRAELFQHLSLDVLGGLALVDNNDTDAGDGFFRISVATRW